MPMDSETIEQELLAIRCQLGEIAAFDELVARWHAPCGSTSDVWRIETSWPTS